MTTYTTYTDGTTITSVSGGNYAGSPARTVLTGVYDASKRNMVAADVATVVTIPAGTWVEAVFLEIITAEATASQTISVGDGDSTAGWVSAVSSSAAAGTKYLGAGALAIATGTSQTNGKYYTTADTLDILVPTSMVTTTLKVKVHAVCSII